MFDTVTYPPNKFYYDDTYNIFSSLDDVKSRYIKLKKHGNNQYIHIVNGIILERYNLYNKENG